jgi:hypothetical protein
MSNIDNKNNKIGELINVINDKDTELCAISNNIDIEKNDTDQLIKKYEKNEKTLNKKLGNQEKTIGELKLMCDDMDINLQSANIEKNELEITISELRILCKNYKDDLNNLKIKNSDFELLFNEKESKYDIIVNEYSKMEDDSIVTQKQLLKLKNDYQQQQKCLEKLQLDIKDKLYQLDEKQHIIDNVNETHEAFVIENDSKNSIINELQNKINILSDKLANNIEYDSEHIDKSVNTEETENIKNLSIILDQLDKMNLDQDSLVIYDFSSVIGTTNQNLWLLGLKKYSDATKMNDIVLTNSIPKIENLCFRSPSYIFVDNNEQYSVDIIRNILVNNGLEHLYGIIRTNISNIDMNIQTLINKHNSKKVYYIQQKNMDNSIFLDNFNKTQKNKNCIKYFQASIFDEIKKKILTKYGNFDGIKKITERQRKYTQKM